MPNIRQFENPIDGLQPNDRATQVTALNARHTEQAFAQGGAALGGAISAVGNQYEKAKAFQDISSLLGTRGELQSNLTTAWNVYLKNADPNDHGAADRFMSEQVQPILDAWSTGPITEEGRKFATEQAAEIKQHFFEKTAGDQSNLAGQAAIDNHAQFVTGMSNTVLQDPTALNSALATNDTAIEALLANNPNIKPEDVSKMRTELREKSRAEITRSAFIGMARSNPDAAMQALQKGFGATDLDGTERNTLFGFAETIKREQRADARADYAMQKEAQKDDFNAKAAAATASLFQPDGSVVVPKNFHQQLAALALHPGADPGRIEAMGNAAATATRAQIDGTYTRTDNSTWQNLAGRIGAPVGSPQSLTHTMVDQAFASGKLSVPDYHFLHDAVEKAGSDPSTTKAMQQLNQSLERVKPLVDKSNLYSGKLDQSGIALYDDLHYDTYQRYEALVAQGKSPAEAVNILTDPRNPQGIQAALPHYQTTNKQGLAVIHQRVSAGGGPTPMPAAPNPATARKPGESAAAYLARMGK